MSNLAVKEEQSRAVARPLKTLERLIQEDIDAGEKAGMEFYRAAGEKLIEAQEGHYEGNASGFWAWATNKFGKSRDTLRRYMSLRAREGVKSFKSLRHLDRETGRDSRPIGTGTRIFRDWTAPVDDIAEKARREAQRLAFREEELTRQQERDAEAKLGLRMIDISYKILAKELHPDKLGGSREAMARLNRVRDRLKASV